MDEELENQNPGASAQGKIILVLIILGVAISLYLIIANSHGLFPFEERRNIFPTCIQVITPARNLQTGEVKDFPTPCDVPEGWEKI